MENLSPLVATFGLTDKDFSKWEAKRWELLRKYHEGKQKQILPCMRGEHFWKGQKFVL